MNTLGLFPRISLRDGRAQIQRGEDFELTYTRHMGSRTYQVSTYRENVSNAALSLVAPAGMYTGGDILPDLFTGTSTFNAGDYQQLGLYRGGHAGSRTARERHRDVRVHRRADGGQSRDRQRQPR